MRHVHRGCCAVGIDGYCGLTLGARSISLTAVVPALPDAGLRVHQSASLAALHPALLFNTTTCAPFAPPKAKDVADSSNSGFALCKIFAEAVRLPAVTLTVVCRSAAASLAATFTAIFDVPPLPEAGCTEHHPSAHVAFQSVDDFTVTSTLPPCQSTDSLPSALTSSVAISGRCSPEGSSGRHGESLPHAAKATSAAAIAKALSFIVIDD